MPLSYFILLVLACRCRIGVRGALRCAFLPAICLFFTSWKLSSQFALRFLAGVHFIRTVLGLSTTPGSVARVCTCHPRSIQYLAFVVRSSVLLYGRIDYIVVSTASSSVVVSVVDLKVAKAAELS